MRLRCGLLILIISIISCANTWAGPAAPLEFEIHQPDGTTFIAIPRGDEFSNWTETLQGHSIVKVIDTWYYAEKDLSGELIASPDPVGGLDPAALRTLPLHLAPDPDPQVFEPATVRKIPRSVSYSSKKDFQSQVQSLAVSHTQATLIILVDYDDRAFTYSDASFQSLILGGTNSVRDYFLDNSYGGFTLVGASENYDTIDDGIIHVLSPKNHPDQGGDIPLSRLEAREIVALADASVDYSIYDADNNGELSPDELSIVIILAGYDNAYGGDNALAPRVWPHKSSFSDLSLDDVVLSPYTMFGETHASYSGANVHQATIGIMAHELGHLMLGLPDLYDTDKGSAGIGDWGLMGSGSWNRVGRWSGDSPSHLSAWSKVATRFTLPIDIDTPQSDVSIASASGSEVAKRVWIDKYKTGLSWEYLLIENRQKTGYDTGLPGDGLLIWHIDEQQFSNSDENRKWVDVEEADGDADLDNDTNDGDSGDPYPGSSVNTVFDNNSLPDSKAYSGNATQISVTGISASGPVMTADFTALAGGVGDHVRYDEDRVTTSTGFVDSTTAWVGIRVFNDTLSSNLDGVELFVDDNSGATIDILYYSSMDGGEPAGLIHTQTGIVAKRGWNRLLLNTPQPFPTGAERGIVLKVVNDSSTDTIVFNHLDTASGRSYFDFNGNGTFTPLCPQICGDLGVVALLSGDDSTAPVASAITAAGNGPTNSDSISFDITFSENVINFNDPADVAISHSGTSHSGVNISGSGTSYTATVTGISGNGSFTLAVETGSDLRDPFGNPLASSVSSAAVIIDNNPPAISISPASANSTVSGPVSYTVTYTSADSISLAEGHITLNTGGTANGSVSVSGSGVTTRTVTISNIAGEGSLGISIAAASAVDEAGNPAPAPAASGTFTVFKTEIIFTNSFD